MNKGSEMSGRGEAVVHLGCTSMHGTVSAHVQHVHKGVHKREKVVFPLSTPSSLHTKMINFLRIYSHTISVLG